MLDAYRANIKNNVIYFPNWRILRPKFRTWTWQTRYLYLTKTANTWTHDCIKLGMLTFHNSEQSCPHCGCNKLNEPTEESINDLIEIWYE